MKKLVTTPLSNTIWWATVNEEKGTMNTNTRVDVTDNAINAVLEHLLNMNIPENKGFSGYVYDKKNGDGTVTIAAFDERYVAINKKLYEDLLEYKEKYKSLCI
jgi:hypothetical protein